MSAASKITKVVTDFFLPMAEGFVPAYTPLTQSPDAEEMLLLEKIWEMFPEGPDHAYTHPLFEVFKQWMAQSDGSSVFFRAK